MCLKTIEDNKGTDEKSTHCQQMSADSQHQARASPFPVRYTLKSQFPLMSNNHPLNPYNSHSPLILTEKAGKTTPHQLENLNSRVLEFTQV